MTTVVNKPFLLIEVRFVNKFGFEKSQETGVFTGVFL